MKDHVQILVCGDEQVGKSSFIGALISRHFPREVPSVMTDVHLPPEETDENVPCTITDCSALSRDRQQLIEKMESADSIVLLYDVTRPETLIRLDTFWLPLMERSAQGVPVVIVRNKVDTLEGGCRERASEDLRRQMAPLEERYKFFHVSLECSSVIELGVSQVFRHALSAALYPVAPLYDATAKRFRPDFERAVRRLFRVYDVDRDGILSDNELNAFQYDAYQLYLSEEDIVALKRILEKLAIPGMPEGARLVQERREGVEGGVTVEGFLRLMQIFIDKKQMQAPWKALYSNHYDDALKLSVPSDVSDPPPGKGGASGSHEEVLYLSQSAELFLRRLFHQHATESDAYPSRILTQEAQAEVFSVIPDPACAPWDYLRSREEFDMEESELFGRLRRAPGACRAMSEEGWVAHWQMVSMNSPSLARAHLFFVGFKGHGEDILVSREQLEAQQGTSRRQRVDRLPLQVFLLGSRGCGKSRALKALRLGGDLSQQQAEAEQRRTEQARGAEGEGGSRPEEAAVAHGRVSGEGGGGDGDDDWEMVADAEVPETCAAYARVDAGQGDGDRRSTGLASCRCLSVAVTEVPETYSDAFIDEQVWRCDLALLVIDPSSRDSVDFVMALMADMPPEVPRVVISCESSRGVNPAVAAAARAMCQELELSAVVMANPETGEGFEGNGDLRQKITDPSRPGTLPYAARQRKAKDLNRKLRTAAIVAALGLAVATGFYLATASSEEPAFPGRANAGGSGAGWEARVGGALRAPVRAAKQAAAVAVEYWRRWRGSVKRVGAAGYGSTASMASMF